MAIGALAATTGGTGGEKHFKVIVLCIYVYGIDCIRFWILSIPFQIDCIRFQILYILFQILSIKYCEMNNISSIINKCINMDKV